MATVTTKLTWKSGGSEDSAQSMTIDNSVASDTAVTNLNSMIGAVSDDDAYNIKYVVTTEVSN